MNMRFRYLTFLRYSPRGTSKNAHRSRVIMGKYKNADEEHITHLAKRIKEEGKVVFFNGATLVPVPRSSLQKNDSVYPSKTIAEIFVKNGIGKNISVLLERFKAIGKSSSQYTAAERNKVPDHLNSIKVTYALIDTPTIILVDDVLTLGRTSMACALLLKEAYPDKEIKIFCPFRTRSFEDKDILLEIKEGEMIWDGNDVKLPD